VEAKEIENQLTAEIVNAIHDVGGKVAYKAVVDILKHCDITPEQLMYVGKYCDVMSKTKLKEKAKQEGKVLTKRLDRNMIVDGLVHILTHKVTPEETMEYIRLKYNQPVDWVVKVKNRPIPRQERTEAVKQLKQKDNLDLLHHMVSDKRLTYKEISEPETWNKQLGELTRTITLSDRVDALEKANKELMEFKEQQLRLNEEQARFNLTVVQEFDNQKKLILSLLDLSPSHLGIGTEEAESLGELLSSIPNEKDRWRYLLEQGYSKLFISKITQTPYATLKRKMKKEGVV
jgi:hypothetical protein